MSEERRKRKEARERESRGELKPGLLRKIVIGLLVAAAFAGAFYLGKRKRTSRLDGFAQCLAGKQAKMYGLYWCTHCADQKEMFGSSFQYVPYVECGMKGGGEDPNCLKTGVKNFPTWEFGNGERKEGALPLKVLSEKSGCSLP